MAVADALGVPYEFLTRGSLKRLRWWAMEANSNWLELVQMILALYSRPMILFLGKREDFLCYMQERFEICLLEDDFTANDLLF